MWRKLFLLLLTIDKIKYRSASMPVQCATRVYRCPLGKNAWTQKNDILKCATNYGYVCLRDHNGYLFESCMANFTIQANEGNCPILYACVNNRPYLGPEITHYSCPKEVPGCPPKNHAEYSIYQLYKYPRCVESNLSDETGNTSSRTHSSIFMTTTRSDKVNRQENKHYVIIIVIFAILLITAAGCIIGYVLYSRKKRHLYAEVTYVENINESKEDRQDLRCWIQAINESEADRIRILPLKEDDTIEVDRIYVPLSIIHGNEKQTSETTEKQTISELTPNEMFYIAPGRPARFIFMLGDAGYGKTVQCRRIAKSWCKAWEPENAQHQGGAWKAGIANQLNSIHTMENEKLKEWEKYLKDFEFLFCVQMRDANNDHVHVRDMIYDFYRRFDILQEHLEHLNDILNVLRDKRYKCLIILDGLDEWNVSESKREYLLNRGLPNCQGMLNCTFLITMRSWRFMEVDPICREGLISKVLRLHGLDKNSIEELTANMLCNYFNVSKHSNDLLEQSENVKKKASLPSDQLGSLMKIPLLAVFFILTWHERIDTGHSLTTFHLSVIEALMKRSKIKLERKITSELSFSGILKNFPYVSSRMPEISRLGKLAFKNLDPQSTTFVLNDVHLKDPEVKETVDLFLTIGLLTMHDTAGHIHEDNIRIRFLHKTFQEFIYTLYFVHDRSEADVVKYINNMVPDIQKTLERSTFLTFVSGLLPAVGCKISSHIADLTSTDEDIHRYRYNYPADIFYKVFHLYNLQLSCYREVRGGGSIKNFQENEMKFVLSDIILVGNDADRLTIRESADILRYHANDIKSLCMKLIPNDNQEGITNNELKTFLHESDSLVSLNIDYDRGKCRLLDDFKPRVQCLHTIGFQNVAFTNNNLTDFLTNEESKRSIKALRLSYIKSADDLGVNYQYQFRSLHKTFKEGYDHLQRQEKDQASEISLPKEKRQPLLNEILKVLPNYHDLSSLHVSYMDSNEDRQMLLTVLPEIKTLEHFGYDGSSINEKSDDVYDAKVIKVLSGIGKLRTVFLCQIILKENIMNFTRMTLLGELRLYQFYMEESHWATFAKSLSSMRPLPRVVLWDTDIDNETFDRLSSSLTIINVDSTEWNRKKSRHNQRQLHFKK